MFLEKLKFIGFFFVGIYSYIHRAFVIYLSLIEAFANFIILLCFKHNNVTIQVINKWDINATKAIIYLTHFLIVVFLYFIIF